MRSRPPVATAAGIACAFAFFIAAGPLRGQTARSPAARGSQVCASCHPKIWESYRRTGMARSFFRPSANNTVEDYTRNHTYYHQASGIYFEMIHTPATAGRADTYSQRQWTIGFDGKRANVTENTIDFVMGSGNHARTYLHRTANGTLAELPLGWYAENGGTWAMNPGYDRPDHQGFQRSIPYGCMFCHNGYPEIPATNAGPRSAPVFSSVAEGIDCQRCHGEGESHVALARGGARAGEIRAAIVNPARLAPERQMEVCMQCHLETTSSPLPASIVRYERKPFSCQPGEPLADFMLHFDRAPGAALQDRFEITGAAYRLRQSQCFRKSGGALTCTTCHDPHTAPQGEEAARHYASVCRQCHAAALNRLVASGAHTASADCVGCHMPKRRTRDVVHAVMTDHLIERRKPARDLLAPLVERRLDTNEYRGEVIPYYPRADQLRPEDELYLASAQVSQQSNLTAGIARLQAAIAKYRPAAAEYSLQLGDALSNAGRFAEAVPVYQEALRREPASDAALKRLALCLSSLKQYASAEAALTHALQLAPDAATWIQLGTVRFEQGKGAEAIAAIEKAIQLDPEMSDAYATAGAVWFQLGDRARAEAALRRAIQLQPNSATAHNNLANLLAAANRFDEARYHFESALRFQPDDNAARYDYASALAKVHRLDEAQAQVDRILHADPNHAAAHDLSGNLLGARGERDRAIEQFREALRIQPDFARANLDLGAALAEAGDKTGAVVYLRRAAGSQDAAARAEAQRLLDRLGQRP